MTDRASTAVLPITTPRLRLRALREDDLDALLAIYTHPLVAPWIGSPTPADVADVLRFYIAHQAAHGYAFWAIEDRSTGRLVGDCGLQPLEQQGPEVELGYDLHPDVWGNGIATEAATAARRAALGPIGLERVIAVVKPDHAASRRVLENAGFVPDGERVAYGETLLLYAATRARPPQDRPADDASE